MEGMQLTPSQLTSLLARTISAKLPVLIVGGPGIGKTAILKKAAADADNDLIISHPAVADPTDAKGFPWAEKGNKRAMFLPFGETARVLESKSDTTWFMDDLGQAPPAVQASYMPWLLERRNGDHVLPDHVTIVAATNRRTDRAGVSGILEPVKSRFAVIVELVPDLTDWCQWALSCPTMPPEVIAFLRFQPDHLYQFKPSADIVNFACPRTWEAAGKILKLNLSADLESVALAGSVGAETATTFRAFLDMFRHLPNIDGILLNPDASEIPTNISALYAISTGLAARANEQNFKRVARYAQRLSDASHGEFATYLLQDAIRRKPTIQQSPDFVRLMVGELGQLVGGGIR